jgi:hypothetical protein
LVSSGIFFGMISIFLPHSKGSGIKPGTVHKIRRWGAAIFEGDIERALFPRQASPMTHPAKRTSLERQRARERAVHELEVERLNARVQELEAMNEALGKAIGLLHSRSEQEPDENPTPTDPSDSSPKKPTSSES